MKNIFQNTFVRYFLIILLIIFLHYVNILKPLENLTTFVLSPLNSMVFSLANKIDQQITESVEKQILIKDNSELKSKINKLEQQIVNLKMFVEENSMIEEQNKYLNERGFEFLNARVIMSSIENNFNLITINKGSHHGIKEGMAVVIEEGTMIGKIIQVSSQHSIVLLLIDNSSHLSTSIVGRSEIVGLVTGEHNTTLKLIDILKNSEIKTGDLVITSGFDKRIPSGLLIGEVDEIYGTESELFKSASINSLTNFNNLRVVSVVLN